MSMRFVLLSALAFAASCGDNLTPPADDGVPFPGDPRVIARVPVTTLVAGDRVNATCDIVDENGEAILDENMNPIASTTELTVVYAHEDSFARDDEDQVIVRRVGTATVRCQAPSLGLTSEPIELTIGSGAAARVFTQLAADQTRAGDPVGVTCIAFDAFDNPVPVFEYTFALSPTATGSTIGPDSVMAEKVGDYEVSCVVSGAGQVETAFLLVLPALPSALAVSLSPERTFYAISDEVAVVAQATDRFANLVDDATYAYAASPTIPSPTLSRFRFNNDGTFELGANVTSETYQSVPLDESVTALVNSRGPIITCMQANSPGAVSDAYMLQQGPGSLLVPVRVEDTFDVGSVTIAGVPATFDSASGNYRAAVPIGFGMNFIDVVATDTLGAENSTTCTILAASAYTAEDATMPGALALRLDNRAVGDPTTTGPINSLNDILHAVLVSPQLRTLVNGGLTAANPINNGSCGVFACEPDVDYNNDSISWGTPTSTVALRDGGLTTTVTLPNVRLTVRACGTTCCIGGSNVVVTTSSISATINFNLNLQGGLLRAAVSGSPSVTVGSVALDGSGFCGFLIDVIESFLTDTVRGAVRDALTSFINSNLGPLLDQVVSSLDINSLGTTFQVPRLDGTGNVSLGFGLAFSSLNITPSRFLLGIGTRFTPGQLAHSRASLGVARRTATPLLDPPGTTTARPVGLSFYEGVLNELLHGLWRGGFMQGTLSFGSGTATIDAALPPVAAITTNNQAKLMLGGVRATITIPGVINDPIAVTFGGNATANVSLSGDDLAFGNLVLDTLFVSFDVSLTQTQRNALEGLLQDVLQDVLGSALNDGLPAFPIPTFTLPPAAATYGLPAGAELGILTPQLSTTSPHYVLTGAFGVR